MHALLLALDWHLDALVLALAAIGGCALVLRMLRRRGVATTGSHRLWSAVLLLTIAAGLATERFGDHERHRLQSMLEGYAPTYAAELGRMDYAALGPDTADDDPDYLAMIARQREWLAANRSISDIYTFHRTGDGRIVLLVDSETDYDGNGRIDGEREQRTPIGEDYEVEASWQELLDRAFAGETTFDPTLAADPWGVWVSAYAPIRGADGAVLGVLGVDFAAASWVWAILAARALPLAMFALLLGLAIASFARARLATEQIARRFLLERNAFLEQTNRELAAANTAALAAARAKSEFLTNVSHEIRTPMTAILGFADLLEDAETSTAERQQYVATIRSSGAHLLAILDDVLDLSKLESGRLRIDARPCAPWALVREVVDLLHEQAERKGIALTATCADQVPATVTSDATRLRQVLLNLVGNAVKFTLEGAVTVRVDQLERAGRTWLTFAVTDTGIGIDAATRQQLFQPFVQADSAVTRRFGGTGLGLSISARLAERLGGRITCTSEPGVGSTFTFELPVRDDDGPDELPSATANAPTTATPTATSPPAPIAAAAPGAAASKARLRVLLAEDMPDNQRLITSMLRRAEVDVLVVNNGREALEALRAEQGRPFDLVLMDMQMPEMDGYMATRELRASGCQIPIIAVTAHALDGDREKCLDAGCDDYARKPVERRQLIAKIDAWTGRAPLDPQATARP